MTRVAFTLSMVFSAAATGSVPVGGGFGKAIETALPRSVKLYGVGVGPQAAYGSGVLVSEDGLVLTVFSLLIDARSLRAVAYDGASYNATVIHRDYDRQLALLQLSSESGPLPKFDYFDIRCRTPESESNLPDCSEILHSGDWVVTAGNPFKVANGAEPLSIAHGVFSTRTGLDARRRVRDFPYTGDVLVIDAITSNPGAPGSVVVNLDGEFVGIIGRVVVSNLTHTHFNYAMPRDVLSNFLTDTLKAREDGEPSLARLDSLIDEREKPETVDIGIRVTRTGYKKLPPMVDRVRWGSPAEAAGLRKDDVILSVNGRNVTDTEEFDERMARAGTDDAITLVVRRDERILSIRIEPTPDGTENRQ